MLQVYENEKLAFFLDGSDMDTSSWMRFIRCARHKEEQNMFAFQHNKSIFYRAFREIPSGTELLVWYDDNYYLQHMGIPVGNWTKDISQHFPGEIFLKNQLNKIIICLKNVMFLMPYLANIKRLLFKRTQNKE